MIKKNRAGGIKLPDFTLYYKARLIKTVWYWHKNRNIYQWNKIESPEKAHAPMVTLFLTKEARICSGAKTASSINGAGKTGQLHAKNEIEHFLTPYTKINSKWITNLNVRPENIKLLEENRQNTR